MRTSPEKRPLPPEPPQVPGACSSRRRGYVLLVAWVAGLFLAGFFEPVAAGPVAPGPRDRCPVCGMFVAPYPDWVAQIEFKDGSREFFDGAKDMFHFYLPLPASGSARSKETVAAIYVTEYYSTQMVGVSEVFFVVGSDVYGPMGKELIPVRGREAAETFLREHKGAEILTFEQVTTNKIPGNS